MDTYSFGVVLLELLTGLPPVDYERNGNDIVSCVIYNNFYFWLISVSLLHTILCSTFTYTFTFIKFYINI